MELIGNALRLFGVCTVDAHVHELEAEHSVHGLAAEAGDLVPVFLCKGLCGHYPAAAAADYFIVCKVTVQVVRGDAASGHEAHVPVGAAHRFYVCHAARLFCGKELYKVQPQFHGLLYLACGGEAGRKSYALFKAVRHHLGVEAGRNAELCACGGGSLCLFDREHRAGAHHHVGEGLYHAGDDLVCALGAESHLGAVYAARAQCRGKLFGIFYLVELYYGHYADVGKFFDYGIYLCPCLFVHILTPCMPLLSDIHKKIFVHYNYNIMRPLSKLNKRTYTFILRT